MTAVGSPRSEAAASPGQGDTLRLSAAPVTLRVPSAEAQWGRRLAAYADSAATLAAELLGTTVPEGFIEWDPDAGSVDAARGRVVVAAPDAETTPTIILVEPFATLARDSGVSFATGYARWLTAYAVARLYFARRAASDAWWDDGAALYLTDVLARRERATTPVLYGLESAYTRALRDDRGVDLRAAERGTLDDAARGKAYLTFRLLEATYGQETVLQALAALSGGGFVGLFRTAISEALPAGLTPAPEALLTSWLEPNAGIDVGIENVSVDDNNTRLRARITRRGDVPVPVNVDVRLASGESLRVEVAAGTGSADIEETISAQPVEIRLDAESLLPDINRGNNRHGFGSAARVREFFALDRQIEIGDLHFGGDIAAVDDQRVEGFSVTLRNLTEEPVGLGLLVSTQWIDRPINRTQRAIFIVVPPGERRLARDFLVYPRLGSGRAQIEARYWRASDPEALTERLLRDPADLINAYIVLRESRDTQLQPGAPALSGAAGVEVTPIAELTSSPEPEEPTAPPETPRPGAAPEGAPADAAEAPLAIRIISPGRNDLPVGDLTFEAAVTPNEDAVEAVDLYVNDNLLGTVTAPPFRLPWTPNEDLDVHVLRAVAFDRNGRIATATRVMEGGGATAFGARVDLVTVYVTVKGPGGSLVRELEQSAFRVLEDGVEQEIQQFARGEQTAVSVALLLDSSSSMIGGGITSARAGARRLVQSLSHESDRAMILGFNERLYLYADFVGDRDRLDAAIEATYADGSTALYDAVVESLRKVNRRGGRRALVVLSDGLDTRSRFGYADVLEYTRQSDVVVYTIGLQLMHDATELGDASGAVKDSVENLRALAEATGGAAYFPLRIDELEEIYAQIAQELEGQYALSYYPSNQQWDGRWREVEIQLPARPGVRVQARPGYYGVLSEQR